MRTGYSLIRIQLLLMTTTHGAWIDIAIRNDLKLPDESISGKSKQRFQHVDIMIKCQNDRCNEHKSIFYPYNSVINVYNLSFIIYFV